jgi:hypothetical protein
MISESVKNILQEHDQEALGRLSARNLEKSAGLAKEMGQSGVFPKDKINRMKHHDKMAHKANRLQHELMGLDPDKNFGHLTHPDFGKGFNDVQDEYSKLKSSISESVKRVLNEEFEDDFNAARDQYLSRKSPNGMFGFEMKNSEGDWQYGDVTYDPNTNTMSCMGVSIEVDPDMSIDQNLEGLYEELMNNGFTDGE